MVKVHIHIAGTYTCDALPNCTYNIFKYNNNILGYERSQIEGIYIRIALYMYTRMCVRVVSRYTSGGNVPSFISIYVATSFGEAHTQKTKVLLYDLPYSEYCRWVNYIRNDGACLLPFSRSLVTNNI